MMGFQPKDRRRPKGGRSWDRPSAGATFQGVTCPLRRLLRCPHCEREFVLKLVADGPYNLLLEVTRDGVVATPVSRDGIIAEGKRVVLADRANAGVAYSEERGFDDDEAPWPVSPPK